MKPSIKTEQISKKQKKLSDLKVFSRLIAQGKNKTGQQFVDSASGTDKTHAICKVIKNRLKQSHPGTSEANKSVITSIPPNKKTSCYLRKHNKTNISYKYLMQMR